jgi:hypothetical protein
MSFIGKLVGYFINEALVKALANNRGFQRFAVRTDSFIRVGPSRRSFSVPLCAGL